MLANLAMREADVLLTALSNRYGLTYTRYADDLTFSTGAPEFQRDDARKAVYEIYGILRRFGLAPNLTKTAIGSPRSRKIVLGLQVDQNEPRLTRAFKMKMRIPSLLAGLQHFNVRKWHKGMYDNQPKGLKQTVESMGLVWMGTYHRGIDDAMNVASIIKEMLGLLCEPGLLARRCDISIHCTPPHSRASDDSSVE